MNSNQNNNKNNVQNINEINRESIVVNNSGSINDESSRTASFVDNSNNKKNNNSNKSEKSNNIKSSSKKSKEEKLIEEIDSIEEIFNEDDEDDSNTSNDNNTNNNVKEEVEEVIDEEINNAFKNDLNVDSLSELENENNEKNQEKNILDDFVIVEDVVDDKVYDERENELENVDINEIPFNFGSNFDDDKEVDESLNKSFSEDPESFKLGENQDKEEKQEEKDVYDELDDKINTIRNNLTKEENLEFGTVLDNVINKEVITENTSQHIWNEITEQRYNRYTASDDLEAEYNKINLPTNENDKSNAYHSIENKLTLMSAALERINSGDKEVEKAFGGDKGLLEKFGSELKTYGFNDSEIDDLYSQNARKDSDKASKMFANAKIKVGASLAKQGLLDIKSLDNVEATKIQNAIDEDIIEDSEINEIDLGKSEKVNRDLATLVRDEKRDPGSAPFESEEVKEAIDIEVKLAVEKFEKYTKDIDKGIQKFEDINKDIYKNILGGKYKPEDEEELRKDPATNEKLNRAIDAYFVEHSDKIDDYSKGKIQKEYKDKGYADYQPSTYEISFRKQLEAEVKAGRIEPQKINLLKVCTPDDWKAINEQAENFANDKKTIEKDMKRFGEMNDTIFKNIQGGKYTKEEYENMEVGSDTRNSIDLSKKAYFEDHPEIKDEYESLSQKKAAFDSGVFDLSKTEYKLYLKDKIQGKKVIVNYNYGNLYIEEITVTIEENSKAKPKKSQDEKKNELKENENVKDVNNGSINDETNNASGDEKKEEAKDVNLDESELTDDEKAHLERAVQYFEDHTKNIDKEVKEFDELNQNIYKTILGGKYKPEDEKKLKSTPEGRERFETAMEAYFIDHPEDKEKYERGKRQKSYMESGLAKFSKTEFLYHAKQELLDRKKLAKEKELEESKKKKDENSKEKVVKEEVVKEEIVDDKTKTKKTEGEKREYKPNVTIEDLAAIDEKVFEASKKRDEYLKDIDQGIKDYNKINEKIYKNFMDGKYKPEDEEMIKNHSDLSIRFDAAKQDYLMKNPKDAEKFRRGEIQKHYKDTGLADLTKTEFELSYRKSLEKELLSGKSREIVKELELPQEYKDLVNEKVNERLEQYDKYKPDLDKNAKKFDEIEAKMFKNILGGKYKPEDKSTIDKDILENEMKSYFEKNPKEKAEYDRTQPYKDFKKTPYSDLPRDQYGLLLKNMLTADALKQLKAKNEEEQKAIDKKLEDEAKNKNENSIEKNAKEIKNEVENDLKKKEDNKEEELKNKEDLERNNQNVIEQNNLQNNIDNQKVNNIIKKFDDKTLTKENLEEINLQETIRRQVIEHEMVLNNANESEQTPVNTLESENGKEVDKNTDTLEANNSMNEANVSIDASNSKPKDEIEEEIKKAKLKNLQDIVNKEGIGLLGTNKVIVPLNSIKKINDSNLSEEERFQNQVKETVTKEENDLKKQGIIDYANERKLDNQEKVNELENDGPSMEGRN